MGRASGTRAGLEMTVHMADEARLVAEALVEHAAPPSRR